MVQWQQSNKLTHSYRKRTNLIALSPRFNVHFASQKQSMYARVSSTGLTSVPSIIYSATLISCLAPFFDCVQDTFVKQTFHASFNSVW